MMTSKGRVVVASNARWEVRELSSRVLRDWGSSDAASAMSTAGRRCRCSDADASAPSCERSATAPCRAALAVQQADRPGVSLRADAQASRGERTSTVVVRVLVRDRPIEYGCPMAWSDWATVAVTGGLGLAGLYFANSVKRRARQDLDREVAEKRFAAYGAMWTHMMQASPMSAVELAEISQTGSLADPGDAQRDARTIQPRPALQGFDGLVLPGRQRDAAVAG